MKNASPKKHKRPFGIYAILVLLVFLAVDNGLDVLRSWAGLLPQTLPESDTPALVVLNIALLIFYVVLAVGLWRMQSRAWYLAMIASGLGLFHDIWRYFQGGHPYLSMIILVIIVFYLNQREVKAAFEPAEGKGTEVQK